MGAGPDPLTDSDPMFPLTSGIQYLDEVVVTGSLNASGVSSDSWLRYIPIFGSGLDAYDSFSRGHYWTGAFHTAMAISDVFLVKSLFTGIAKGGYKAFGKNYKNWSSWRSFYGKNGFADKGQDVHHWLFEKGGKSGSGLWR